MPLCRRQREPMLRRVAASWPESAHADINPLTIAPDESGQADFAEAHDDLKLILTPAEDNRSDERSPLSETPDPVFVSEGDLTSSQYMGEENNPDLKLALDEQQDFDASQAPDYAALQEPITRNGDDREEPTFAPIQMPAVSTPTSDPFTIFDEDDLAYRVELRSQPAEPAFVQRARQEERTARFGRIVLLLLILGLLPALCLQVIDAFHQRITAAFPDVKPVLAQVCAVIECQTDLPMQIEAVSIDASELHAPKNGEKAFGLNLLLRNRSAMAQAWPYIELTLNDANEKPVVRRVFKADEYIAGVADRAQGFAGNTEKSIKLVFEVEQLKPIGYRVYLFYP